MEEGGVESSLPPPLLPPPPLPPPPPPPPPLPLLRLLHLRLPLSLLEDGVVGRGTRRGRLPAVVARLGVDLYPTLGREGPATAGGLVPTPMVGPPEAAADDEDEPVLTPMRGLGDVTGGGEGVSKLRPPPTPMPPPGGVTRVTY